MRTLGGELIRRMAAGDREAFGRFYDRYAPIVYPLVLRIARDPADAADVVQEVFWAAWQAATTYDENRGSPEAWIVVRARSRAIDRLRTNRRRGETFVAPIEEGAGQSNLFGTDPATRAADRALVRTALERLSGAQREVIELAYYEGLTQTEIAERIKEPLGTVKTRIRLGLERLREVLKQPT
jgi:RNA polymerase sigma-70 factor, ECF subfamily